MIIVKTPLLLPLARPAEDNSNEYASLSFCMDKFHYIIVKERFDYDIYINARNKERVSSAEEVQHDLIRSALLEFGLHHGVEITLMSDIPRSMALDMGMEAAFFMGLVHALASFKGELLSNHELVDLTLNLSNRKSDQVFLHELSTVSTGGIVLTRHGNSNSSKPESIRLSDSFLRVLGARFQVFEIDADVTVIPPDENDSADILKNLLISEDPFSTFIGIHQSWQNHTASICKEFPAMETVEPIIWGCRFLRGDQGGGLLVATPRSRQNEVLSLLPIKLELPFMIEKFPTRVVYFSRRYPSK